MEGNIKKCVVDSSFLLSYLLPDENSEIVNSFMAGHQKNPFLLFAPIILYFEISNALRSAVLSKRISKNQAHDLLKNTEKLKIKIADIDFENTLDVALQAKLSFYDASYVTLASTLDVQLLTLDKKLALL